MSTDDLERDLRLVYGAYEYLHAHDLAGRSTTSRLLREGDLVSLARRAAGEVGELRGAVAGTHGHGGGRDDIVLEAYQSFYWLTLLAVAAGDRYDDVRPHENLASIDGRDAHDGRPIEMPDYRDSADRRDFLRAGFASVAGLCRRAGVPVAEAARRDLDELRGKDYLAPYWGQADGLVIKIAPS